jgi:LysR family transcriptional regulator of abg operon
VEQGRGAVRLKLNQLRDFVAVARHGSLRAAARDLGLGQPTLTKSIQALERELGAPLLVRHRKGALLTVHGEAFLPRARLVMEELGRGQRLVAQLADQSNGEVAFGICATSCALFLPPMLEAFRRRYPLARVRIVEDGQSPSLLRDGELDFVIGPQPLPNLRDEIVVEPLLRCDCVVVTRAGHPQVASTSLGALLGAEWIRPIAGRFAATFDAAFEDLQLAPPARQLQVDTMFAALQILLRSDALCVAPRALLRQTRFEGALEVIPVREALPKLSLCLMYSSGLPPTPAADLLVNQVRRTAITLRRCVNEPTRSEQAPPIAAE